MGSSIRSVVIVGGGPAGATLATLLAENGKEVVLFDNDKRPPLVVGESLIPAVIPILRRLGIEDEIKSYSMLKPGATFLMDDVETHFCFGEFGTTFPEYAYNVPRDRFDATLSGVAERSGAHVIHASAGVELNSENGKPVLSAESLALANEYLSTDGPDLLVDASGRRRLFSNLMSIPSQSGSRSDSVLFAHLESANTTMAGHIHIGRMTHGWIWFIPLPGKVSVGIVMDSEKLKSYGDSIEESFDALLAGEPTLKRYIPEPKRLTPVVKYSSYQWVSEKLSGDGWALVGDAAGFIDPVFSSGLYLGMQGAERLADAILEGGSRSLERYESDYFSHIRTWQRIVDYYYSGELFALFIIGRDKEPSWYSRLFRAHVRRHMGRVFTGQAATGTYSLRLLDFMTKYAIKSEDCADVKIN